MRERVCEGMHLRTWVMIVVSCFPRVTNVLWRKEGEKEKEYWCCIDGCLEKEENE